MTRARNTETFDLAPRLRQIDDYAHQLEALCEEYVTQQEPSDEAPQVRRMPIPQPRRARAYLWHGNVHGFTEITLTAPRRSKTTTA